MIEDTLINHLFLPTDPTRPLDDPTRRDRRWATSSVRLHAKTALFVRGFRAVEACVWVPRAVSEHGGLRIRYGCQWPSLFGRLGACAQEVSGRCSFTLYEGVRGVK